jgi:hypothetical protein
MTGGWGQCGRAGATGRDGLLHWAAPGRGMSGRLHTVATRNQAIAETGDTASRRTAPRVGIGLVLAVAVAGTP